MISKLSLSNIIILVENLNVVKRKLGLATDDFTSNCLRTKNYVYAPLSGCIASRLKLPGQKAQCVICVGNSLTIQNLVVIPKLRSMQGSELVTLPHGSINLPPDQFMAELSQLTC